MLQGFGLSLIYKGLDKYEEHEVGVFVARVVPGGQSQKAGLKENDKILKINNKVNSFPGPRPDRNVMLIILQTPNNVNDAVSFIKKAGRSLILSVERAEPHDQLEEGRLSRTGSVRSFNTAYGASRPQSPGDSEGEQEDDVTRHHRLMAAHQAELLAKEAAIAEQERRLQSQRAEQERQARLLEQERAEQMRLHQLQQDSIMRARAEEEERQRKLQEDLDNQLSIAQLNAGRGRSTRRYSDSSNEDGYGGHHARSKSLDARKTPRSKSPGAW